MFHANFFLFYSTYNANKHMQHLWKIRQIRN